MSSLSTKCEDSAEQKALLQVFTPTLRDRWLWKVLICSRFELAISITSKNAPLMNISTCVLDDEGTSADDIRRLLIDEFDEINRTHLQNMFTPADWPSSDTINKLVSKFSWQFIYAETVIKYVRSDYHNPCCRLEAVLGIKESPFAVLDFPYTHPRCGRSL